MTNNWRLGEWGSGILRPNEKVGHLAFSPNGQYLALGVYDEDGRSNHRLMMVDYAAQTAVWEMAYSAADGYIYEIGFTPDSSRLLASVGDSVLTIWDVATGQRLNELSGHQSSIRGLDVSPDGQHAITTGLDNMTIYWDIERGEPIHFMLGHISGSGTTDVRFLNDGQYAATSAFDSTVILWDLESGTQIKRLTGLNSTFGGHLDGLGVFKIIQPPFGQTLLSGGGDQTLILWDLESGESIKEFVGQGDEVRYVELIEEGSTFLASSMNNRLLLWDIESATPIREFTPAGRSVSFAPIIAVHPINNRILIDEPPSGRLAELDISEPSKLELLEWIQENRFLRELTCLERETYQIEPICIDGVSAATSDELLMTLITRTVDEPIKDTGIVSTDLLSGQASLKLPDRNRFQATTGENRGTLSAQNFDTWLYEGQAGETVSIELIADSPVADETVPVERWNDAGVLDTVMLIRDPQGRLLGRALEGRTSNYQVSPNAKFEALVLPSDGTYEIENSGLLSAFPSQGGPAT
ncbi:MAG: WD40 repeat domain-containing protein, partial [Chloroflexota bacterium]